MSYGCTGGNVSKKFPGAGSAPIRGNRGRSLTGRSFHTNHMRLQIRRMANAGLCDATTRGPMSDPIEALIEKTAFGNQTAYKELYRRTAPKLFAVCLRILNNRSQAEDALQEVFVKIWKTARQFDRDRARGMTWLIAIARNQSIDVVRARKPAPVSVDDASEIPDDLPSPESQAITSDDTRKLKGCLEELSTQHGIAVQKTYLSGWTYQEAAEELKVPLNTVKTWIRRSLLALRDCMNR